MNEEKHIKEITRLITSFLKGDINNYEAERLEDWKQSSSKNKELFDDLINGKLLPDNYHRYREAEKADDWNVIAKRIRGSRSIGWKRYLPYAAVAMLAVGIAMFFFRDNHQSEQSLFTEILNIEPADHEAMLILSGGEKVSLSGDDPSNQQLLDKHGISCENNTIQVAADSPSSHNSCHKLVIPRGGEYILMLEDGSKVWLNAESVLEFPVNFSANERTLTLVYGEAYFRVAKDKKRPFRVNTAGMQVEVTGTEFNLMNYKESGQVETTLVNGAVRLHADDETLVLKPGEQGAYHKELKDMHKQKVDVTSYISWKDGVFEFQHMTMEKVCQQLSRWYDVDFVFQDEAVKKICFTGAILRSKSLNFILKTMHTTGTIKYRIEGKKVLLYR